jgi:hypothetical protein
MLRRSLFFLLWILLAAGCGDDTAQGPDADVDASVDASTDTDAGTDSDCVEDKWVSIYSSLTYYSSRLDGLWVGVDDGAVCAYNRHRLERIFMIDDLSWESERIYDEGLLGFSGPSEEDQYRSYLDGTVRRFDGTSYTTVRDLDNFEDVWIADDGTGFIIEDGRLLRFDGAALEEPESDGTVFTSVVGIAPDDVYAASCDGLYHFDGVSLALLLDPVAFMDLSSSCDSVQVWVTSEGHVFYAWGSYLLEYDGLTWTNYDGTDAFYFSFEFVGVSGTGLDDFFAVARYIVEPYPDDKSTADNTWGEWGTVWYFEDGEPSVVWEENLASYHGSDPAPHTRMVVWSAEPGRAEFVAGDTLYVFDGLTTNVQTNGVYDIWVDPSGEAWATGYGGVVMHRADSSSPWTEEAIAPVNEVLSGIWSAEGAGQLTVGAYGTLAVREGETWTTLLPADPCGFIRSHEMADGQGWGICANPEKVAHFYDDGTWEYPDLPIASGDSFYPTSLAVAESGEPTFVGQFVAEGSAVYETIAVHMDGGEWVVEEIDPGMPGSVEVWDVHVGDDMTGLVVGQVNAESGIFDFIEELGGEHEAYFPETGCTDIGSIWGLDMERVIAADGVGNVWYKNGDAWDRELVCHDRAFVDVAGDHDGDVYLLHNSVDDTAILRAEQIWE